MTFPNAALTQKYLFNIRTACTVGTSFFNYDFDLQFSNKMNIGIKGNPVIASMTHFEQKPQFQWRDKLGGFRSEAGSQKCRLQLGRRIW